LIIKGFPLGVMNSKSDFERSDGSSPSCGTI